MQNNKEIFRYKILSLYFYLLVLALLYKLYLRIIFGYSKESWSITEFLINYRGGFVRRGLLGEIILYLYNSLSLNPYYTIVIFSIISYCVLVVFFIKSFLKNGYPIFFLPFVFFLGNPIINDFWVRKDIFLVLIYIAAIYLSLKESFFYILLTNLVLIAGLLVHEAIGFFTLPIIFLIRYNKNKIKTDALLISFSKLLPSIFTFLGLLYFKGSLAIANIIWDSWKKIKFPIQKEDIDFPPSAIRGLSWSLKKGLSLTYDTIKNYNDGIYAPFIWIIIVLLIYYLLINTDKLNFPIYKYNPNKNFDRNNISKILIFQFICIIPLFIIGWDYSRWIFFWVTSSFAAIIIISEDDIKGLFPLLLSKLTMNVNAILDCIFSKSRGFIVLLSLIIGFPDYSWNLLSCVKTSSLIIVMQFVSKFIKKSFELFSIFN